MHFIIMGSGRVGVSLAGHLDTLGHSVAIIDQDPEAFRRLPSGFSGQKVKGLGFDREVLKQAGIEDAYAFAAVSSGDNSNILAARVAREIFGVERVVARIYDPPRAELYQRLGIPTICTVNWSTRAMLRQIMPAQDEVIFTDNEADTSLFRMKMIDSWVGQSLASVQELSGARIAYGNRLGKSLTISDDLVVQEHDEFTFVAATDFVPEAIRILNLPPESEN